MALAETGASVAVRAARTVSEVTQQMLSKLGGASSLWLAM
jgi:hypothetical protein